MSRDSEGLADTTAPIAQWARDAAARIGRSFRGRAEVVELALVALLCRGHLLVEDRPGVGKTILARSLSRFIGGVFHQIQCTPDLLPADILGVSIFDQASGSFRFRQGPIMANCLLVDEINRATPRTQSALLEAMAEGQVSVESKTLRLPDPFFLIATQSPLESEGTFPLPEVQKDRFFLSLTIGYPSRENELAIMRAPFDRETSGGGSETDPTEPPHGPGLAGIETIAAMQEAVTRIHVADSLRDYIVEIVSRTRGEPRLAMGVSPRGSLALYKGSQALAALRGRDYVVPEDIKEIAGPVLSNRLLFKPEHVARGVTAPAFVDELLSTVTVPGYEGSK